MAFTNTYSATSNGLLDRLAIALKASGERLELWRTYRRTCLELAELDDRDLADLGLSRSMIRAVAFEAAYGSRA